MHKKSVNELSIKLDIVPSGPILIAAGKPEDEAGSSNEDDRNLIKFVTTHRNTGKTVYIPGSSLKGVIRSYCEKVARTLGAWCCNPLLNRSDDRGKADCSCGKKVEFEKEQREEIPVPEIYKDLSCHLCKLFGSSSIASRIFIEDAHPSSNMTSDTKRVNNAIDRTRGAAQSGALFSMEVVERRTHFATEIHIRNFELWQLGLLGLAIRDLHRERIRIGFAKSRGLGKVKGIIKEFTITYPFHSLSADKRKMRSLTGGDEKNLLDGGKFHIYGVGSLMGDAGVDYGYCVDDRAEIEVSDLPETGDDWINSEVRLTNYEKQVEPLLRACVEEHWVPRVTDSQENTSTQEG